MERGLEMVTGLEIRKVLEMLEAEGMGRWCRRMKVLEAEGMMRVVQEDEGAGGRGDEEGGRADQEERFQA
ncbi:hypothetical protein DUI87_24604 [Hirundo rustica rustica]|uniref:Uncharacterized protein n=1 Tax=Hirundo rustica rustica TaxID=333673 RepID=A0A3M0JE02_HIRRU|nr:hypothetical protein DUI87_24604 [Hirundo rustica rustica]